MRIRDRLGVIRAPKRPKKDHEPASDPWTAGSLKGRPRRAASSSEVKIIGRNAVEAVERMRRDDIVRVYIDEALISAFAPLLKWCAKTRRAYHVVPTEELDRVTESTHHEGLCAIVKRRPVRSLGEALRRCRGPSTWLLLDGIRNPHNVGAIMRTAAHLGVPEVLVSGASWLEPPPVVYRTAEGGAEHVEVLPFERSPSALRSLKSHGFAILGMSSHASATLYDFPFPERVLLAFGAEREGLSPALEAMLDATVSIPGTGAVESLNVSCAVAVTLAELWRRRGLRVT